MDFKPNITHAEVIKKEASEGTYFRNIYSSVTDKFYENSWKEFNVLKDIDQKYYCSNYYDGSVNKHQLEFGEIKDGLVLLILMVGFNGNLDIG